MLSPVSEIHYGDSRKTKTARRNPSEGNLFSKVSLVNVKESGVLKLRGGVGRRGNQGGR